MQKLKDIVHYICEKCSNQDKLGATKLNKILWYLDTFSYKQNGTQVTEATYVKRQYGPFPEQIWQVGEELEKEGKICIRTKAIANGCAQKIFISLKKPCIDAFSADEISMADSIIEIICNKHTAKSISEHTHDKIWETAEIGEELPLYTVFANSPGELDENDINWAKNLIH